MTRLLGKQLGLRLRPKTRKVETPLGESADEVGTDETGGFVEIKGTEVRKITRADAIAAVS